jgi:hypothetical protein
MAEGVDYSHTRPDPRCLAQAGKRFAVRYIGTPNSGKNLTAPEADRLRAAGIDLVAVYETTADFMLAGFDRGVRAAREATADGARYGLPAHRPIYYALDIDPRPLTAAQWNAVNRFCDGAASVTGRHRVGVYGGWLAIEQLVPENAPYGWQTYAWSGGKVSPLAHLLQYRNGAEVCSQTVDLCRSLKADYGQWSLEDDMTPAQAEQLAAIHNAVINLRPTDAGTHVTFLRAKGADDKTATILERLDVLEAAVAQLGAGGDVDYGKVQEAAEAAVRKVAADAATP